MIYLFFLICLVSVSVYSLFFIYITLLFLFQIVFCSFLYVFCLFCYLVFIRSVFPVTLSLCYSVFPLILSLCYSVFPLILSLCHSVSFLSIFPLILPLCHSVYSLSFCLFSCFCRTFSPPTFPFILASFLPFHLFIF